jgi:hypothetical protein
MVFEDAELIRMRVQLQRVFTPGAPVSNKDSLAGRGRQVRQIITAVGQVGAHAVIFGERGVGKTSLAGLIHDFWKDAFKDSGIIAPRINCEPLDDFSTIWASIGDEITSIIKDTYSGDESPLESQFLYQLCEGNATPQHRTEILSIDRCLHHRHRR